MFNRIHLVCKRNSETERDGMFLKKRIIMMLKKRTQKDSKAQYIICQNYKKSCIAHSPRVQIGAWPSWLLQRHHYHYYVYGCTVVHHMLSLCNACKVYWLTCIALTWFLKKTWFFLSKNTKWQLAKNCCKNIIVYIFFHFKLLLILLNYFSLKYRCQILMVFFGF